MTSVILANRAKWRQVVKEVKAGAGFFRIKEEEMLITAAIGLVRGRKVVDQSVSIDGYDSQNARLFPLLSAYKLLSDFQLSHQMSGQIRNLKLT